MSVATTAMVLRTRSGADVRWVPLGAADVDIKIEIDVNANIKSGARLLVDLERVQTPVCVFEGGRVVLDPVIAGACLAGAG